MVLNPEVQRKAQAEIDTVVGTGRLPNFADRPNLPGVERVLMETFRYMPVVPLSVSLSFLSPVSSCLRVSTEYEL